MLKSAFFIFSLFFGLNVFATAKVARPVDSQAQQYRYEKTVNAVYTANVSFRALLGESDFKRLDGYNYSSIEIYGYPTAPVEGSIQMQFYPQGLAVVNWFNAQTRNVNFNNLTPDIHHNTLAQGGLYFSSSFVVERVVFTFTQASAPVPPPNPAVLIFTKKVNMQISRGQQYLDSFNDSRIQGCKMVEWQFDVLPLGQRHSNYVFEFTSGNTKNTLGTVYSDLFDTHNAWALSNEDYSSMGSYGIYDYFKFRATDQDIFLKEVSLKCKY
jgi:hypothetical protein